MQRPPSLIYHSVYIGAGVGVVVVVVEGKGKGKGKRGGAADHSARSHFAAVWNPELNRVAFLHRLLTHAVRSSMWVLPAAWLRAPHKSHTL